MATPQEPPKFFSEPLIGYDEPVEVGIMAWNVILSDTCKRIRTHVQTPTELVFSVESGKEYILSLRFSVEANYELTYKEVEVRLVGQADQVEFVEPPGAVDYDGNPRIHLHASNLFTGGGRDWEIRFRARKTMSTRSLKFNTGVYGILVPQGHFWTVLSPTV